MAKSGKSASKRGASKPPAGAAPAKRSYNRDSVGARVVQKLREALPFKSLDSTEKFVVVDADGFTLQQRLEADIVAAEKGEKVVEFGHSYNKRLADQYRGADNVWTNLKVPADDASLLDYKLQLAPQCLNQLKKK